jgi:peroxiredoxin
MIQNETKTLAVGSQLPDFRLAAANRDGTFSVAELIKGGPVVVEVLRGTWCPNCRKRLHDWENKSAELRGTGAQLLYVAAEKRNGIWKPTEFLRKEPVSFPFLLDEDRAVTKLLGLYHRINWDSLHIAHPATLITDCSGIVRYIYRGINQADRAPLETVISILKNIQLSTVQCS